MHGALAANSLVSGGRRKTSRQKAAILDCVGFAFPRIRVDADDSAGDSGQCIGTISVLM